jgi:hypothetical protein
MAMLITPTTIDKIASNFCLFSIVLAPSCFVFSTQEASYINNCGHALFRSLRFMILLYIKYLSKIIIYH